MEGEKTSFFDQVYKIVRRVPKGKVITYGQIAEILGTRDARKVGWALHSNKDPQKTPCHRVVNKKGKLAPSYVFGGPNEQKNRLLTEGITFIDKDHVDLEKHSLEI